LESEVLLDFYLSSDCVVLPRCSGGFGQAENSFPVETIPLDHPVFYSLPVCKPPSFQLSSHADLQVVIENNQAFVPTLTPVDLIHYGRARRYLAEASSCIHLGGLLSGYSDPFLWEADTLLKFAVALED